VKRKRKNYSRRNAVIWLLRPHLTLKAIGKRFSLSPERVRQIEHRVDRLVRLADLAERMSPTMAATQRLIAAGALPPPPLQSPLKSKRTDRYALHITDVPHT
jgi:hypothetical protein